MKKVMAAIAISATLLTICVPVLAHNEDPIPVPSTAVQDTITIIFPTETQRNNYFRSLDKREQTKVNDFFKRNQLDCDYYIDWINKHSSGASSVTFAVLEPDTICPESKDAMCASGSSYPSRLVYGDVIYDGQNNQRANLTVGELMRNAVTETISIIVGKYNPVIGSLASFLELTDPYSLFGNYRVQSGKDYYVYDWSKRLVAKFAELNAPVSGTTRWYPWACAEGDYYRYGIQLKYKGLDIGPKKNEYKQYYTSRYYLESALVSKAQAAYPNYMYTEAADQYAASVGGYQLYERYITAAKYLEYDELCN